MKLLLVAAVLAWYRSYFHSSVDSRRRRRKRLRFILVVLAADGVVQSIKRRTWLPRESEASFRVCLARRVPQPRPDGIPSSTGH